MPHARSQDPGGAISPQDAHALIEANLATIGDLANAAGCPKMLARAMSHTLLAPAKRARGVMVLIAATALGARSEAALSSAAALEMLHAASLILDDLPAMDDAALRRGRSASHVAFGEDTAILASIGLINLAYRSINADTNLDAEQRSAISLILADAVGPQGLTGGQFDDLNAASAHADLAHVEHVHDRKTARLFAAAAEIGAVVAHLPSTAGTLKQFGQSLGLAFQAFDDVLDATAQTHQLGKDAGKDAHKATVIQLLGTEAADARGQAHLASATAALAPVPKAAEEALVAYALNLVDGMKRQSSS